MNESIEIGLSFVWADDGWSTATLDGAQLPEAAFGTIVNSVYQHGCITSQLTGLSIFSIHLAHHSSRLN